ncbi:MAG: hypothetical protein ACE5JD_17850, partial [Candidatus Methylomirabilia bacterium]
LPGDLNQLVADLLQAQGTRTEQTVDITDLTRRVSEALLTGPQFQPLSPEIQGVIGQTFAPIEAREQARLRDVLAARGLTGMGSIPTEQFSQLFAAFGGRRAEAALDLAQQAQENRIQLANILGGVAGRRDPEAAADILRTQMDAETRERIARLDAETRRAVADIRANPSLTTSQKLAQTVGLLSAGVSVARGLDALGVFNLAKNLLGLGGAGLGAGQAAPPAAEVLGPLSGLAGPVQVATAGELAPGSLAGAGGAAPSLAANLLAGPGLFGAIVGIPKLLAGLMGGDPPVNVFLEHVQENLAAGMPFEQAASIGTTMMLTGVDLESQEFDRIMQEKIRAGEVSPENLADIAMDAWQEATAIAEDEYNQTVID